MTAPSPETQKADQLLEELGMQAPRVPTAPTMGRLKRVSYTHEALIDLIIEHPEMDQNHLAAYFGYTPGWISNILAADSFKAAMAARRDEILDPALKATIKERFEGLLIQSLTVLHAKLSQPAVSDRVALEAAALGARALGHFNNSDAQPPVATVDRLERLAGRLVQLQATVKERVLSEKDGAEVIVLESNAR